MLGIVAEALGVVAAIVVGVFVLHNSASNSDSSNLISDEINEFTEAEKKLKAELFLGFVMIMARIFSSSSESTNAENIESIEQSEASATAGLGGIGTAMSINLAQDVIQKIAVPELGDSHIETFPAAENKGPKVETFPETENKGPEVLGFPKTEQESKILAFPGHNPVKPHVETFPAETPKELGDNILYTNEVNTRRVEYNVADRVWKEIDKKKIKGLREQFQKALDNGIVGARGEEGIKIVNSKKYKGVRYGYEVKILGKYGDYRIYGNKNPKTGEIDFTSFGTH